MSEINPNEERMRVLRMLEEKKITAEEAIGLINSLGRGESVQTESPKPVAVTNQSIEEKSIASKWRFFRVRVTDTKTGRPKALVTIPIGLMHWGLKIGAQFSPEVEKIKVEDFDQLMETGIDGKLVDVVDEEDGEHVEVFVE
jgi:hypothetical protein